MDAKRRWRVGDKITCQDTEDKWLPSTVKAVKQNQILVSYDGWADTWDEWIDADSPRIQGSVAIQWRVGARLECKDTVNEWRVAVIKTLIGDQVLVSYVGWDVKWDEWVSKSSSRLRPCTQQPKPKSGKSNRRNRRSKPTQKQQARKNKGWSGRSKESLDAPVETEGRWVERENFCGRKSFGWFECIRCRKGWVSAHARTDCKQGCKKCNQEVFAKFMWENTVDTRSRCAECRTVRPNFKCTNCDVHLCESCKDDHVDLDHEVKSTVREIEGHHDFDRCEACRKGVCDAVKPFTVNDHAFAVDDDSS